MSQKLHNPKVDRSQAEKILREVPSDNAFYFYIDIGRPTGVSAKSIRELTERMKTVDPKSIEFHVVRGDFDKWFIMLGDHSLARDFGKLRDLRLRGAALRDRASNLLNSRYKTLTSSAA